LKKVGDVAQIKLHVNSPGGDVFDGLAIYNTLKKHKAAVEVEIDGLAASIASIVAMSGDTVRMAKNAFFMIHNPWTFAYGEAKDLRHSADTLDQVRGSLLATYADKTGEASTEQQLSDWMDAETWFTAEDARKHGFIDEVTGELAMAARFDLSRYKFKNMPKLAESGADSVLHMPEDIRLRARIAHMSMWSAKHKPSSATQA
jgi:ATP-dependent Clp endopeptidase proteolytic subunit ClpP